MNQASLLIEVPQVHEIKFRTPFDVPNFERAMRRVFKSSAQFYPRYQEWTLRFTADKAETERAVLDAMIDVFYPDIFISMTETVELQRVVEIAPIAPKVAPAPVPHQKPAGETYGGIDI